jgi:HTH-type transcriptional regulator / antitoxin HigA
MQIFPVRNDQDHSRALARIEKLMDADLTAAQGDELDALVTLVSAYEEKHYKIAAPTPVMAIEFWMDQRGLSRKDLEPALGSRARVSEILNGKRTLTLGMIRKLHTVLGIPVDLLVVASTAGDLAANDGYRRTRSPQEKKDLSLHRDRRNTYGENAKSSRKNIPKSKHRSQRAERRAASAPLRTLSGRIDDETAEAAELRSRTEGIKTDRVRFKKFRDKPLGQVLQKKAMIGRNSWKAMGKYPPV